MFYVLDDMLKTRRFDRLEGCRPKYFAKKCSYFIALVESKYSRKEMIPAPQVQKTNSQVQIPAPQLPKPAKQLKKTAQKEKIHSLQIQKPNLQEKVASLQVQ